MSNKKNFDFKNFIYLNTDVLKSFIAQKYKGFPKEMQSANLLEHTEEENGEKITEVGTVEGGISAHVFNVEADKTETKEGKQVNQANTESSQDVISKIQRDNMYNDFLTYLETNNLFANANDSNLGKYIELHDTFYFIDFERINKMCDAYEVILNSNGDINGITYEEVQKIRAKVKLLEEIIPFDALLYNTRFVILIDKEWLRAKKNHLGYMIGGNITVVGRVNKKLDINNTATSVPNVINMLNEMQGYAMSLLYELGTLDLKEVNIVTPIAIYH